MLRARFDETRKIKDMRILAKQLVDAEAEHLSQIHEDPAIYKNDPGGICYRRELPHQNFMFDHYHPWEQAQLRDFFETRDKLKEEYDEYFEKSLVKKYKPEPQIV